MLNKFIWIMSVLTKQCHTHSSAKINIYTFLFVLGMFVWSFHFLKTCLDKKESPAVYILANVTLRKRTVLVWGVKLCTYCSPAAAPQITCWWLKASEGYFFHRRRTSNKWKDKNSLCLCDLLNYGMVQKFSYFSLPSYCHNEGFCCYSPWFNFVCTRIIICILFYCKWQFTEL